MLDTNTRPPQPDAADEEELDSPLESLSKLSFTSCSAAESADDLPDLPRPQPLQLTRPPLTERSSTDPAPSALLQGYFANTPLQRPKSSGRNRSPYSRSHLRSRSSGSALQAPIMTRAHSMPNPHLPRGLEMPSSATPSSGSLSPGRRSPLSGSPRRVRSPFRQEEGYAPPPRSPGLGGLASSGGIGRIEEDSELDITPRSTSAGSMLPAPTAMASFTRSNSSRRRPASPLHSLANASAQHTPTSAPTNSFDGSTPFQGSTASSGSNSPSLGPQKFNESYPSLHSYASTSSFSSMPSTPTSARSRSPSISSLETLDEAPDLESQAIEAEEIERLKLAAEREERLERGEPDPEDNTIRRRSSLDQPRMGFGRVGRERKRWSVCGGERRGDLLDLETIWED